MKQFFAVLAALMLLCSCSTTESKEIQKVPAASEKTEVSHTAETAPPPAIEEIPDGYETVDFGEFSVLVCEDSFADCAPMETVTMENNQFIGDDGENKRVIAELLSVENVTDSANPFSPYDKKYEAAVDISELTFNNYNTKKYHVQAQIDSTSSMLSNSIFYCIHLNDKMITFAYYPVMGYGGLHTENIESILATMK